ncbi:MAG: hypothetical protein SRB2_03874 [Desulfobacteraceae bacterium Eth-SRB2]|nr:MAG: hypothetical protein SRB2_03874 [Desulfobacteraceae bacterium Eth-SRB2]
MNDILEKIKKRGFWTVRMHPVGFNKDRITMLSDLVEAVSKCAIELRGWDFPHFDYKSSPIRTADYVEQKLDWQHHVEIWRAYKSGQFVSISALWVDWRDQSGLWPAPSGWSPGFTLSVEDTVFHLVEIFEFAARWGRVADMGNEMIVECKMQGLKDRTLEIGRGRAGFGYHHTASVEEWVWKRKYPNAVLFSASRELAIEPAINLFELFEWDTSKDDIVGIQKELRA